MWAPAVVLVTVFSLSLGDTGQVFDVTTIYDVGNLCISKRRATVFKPDIDEVDRVFEENQPDELQNCTTDVPGWIHARTNALGLSIINELSDKAVPQRSELLNITCDPIDGVCNWDMEDWQLTKCWLKMRERKAYAALSNHIFKIQYGSKEEAGSGESFIYFTSSSSNLRSEGKSFYLMRFSSTESSIEFYIGCSTNQGSYTFSVTDRDGAKISIYCQTHQANLQFLSKGGVKSLKLGGNQYIRIYKDADLQYSEYDSYYYGPYTTANYFSLSGHYLSPASQLQVYSSTTNGSEMVSPIITPDSRQMCLVLVFHSQDAVEGDLLQILAEDLQQSRHTIQTVKNVQAGWNVKHEKFTLEKKISGTIKLIIKKVNSVTVQISRVSTCNWEGQEIEQVTSVSQTNAQNRFQLPVYTTSTEHIMPADKPLNTTNPCYNGGQLTTAGCACHAGFSGPHCELGCGRNRFGHDCGGLCSLHPQECKGLILCTKATHCHCAPGYWGTDCKDECLPGQYGNDCAQRCGSCASGSLCDIYTGECTGCEPGYVYPYCTKPYVYYSAKPDVSHQDYNTITTKFYVSRLLGYGTPKLYQVQYREVKREWNTYCSKSVPKDEQITETIEGLKDGVLYQVRVLLMDGSYNKYDGSLIQHSEIITKCDIPEEYNYQVKAVADKTSFNFSFTYVNESVHWCPIENFEVFWEDNGFWKSANSDGSHTLTDFLPGSTIKFKVRAKTSGGFAPYSEIILISTHHDGSLPVRDLRVVSSSSSSVEITWQPPVGIGNRQLQYRISYLCINQLGCSPGCDNATKGVMTQDQTSLTLNHLLPFTQYLVSVAPEEGIHSTIYVGTTEVAPTEIPRLSDQHPLRYNTSLTVFWEEVPVCSSFLQGYTYQLIKESESLTVLASGFTKSTKATFYNLTASTDYIVKVFVTTVVGWSSESFLSIKTSTSGTVPEPVRNLTVYKRGRSMLGLRWAAPKALYGSLKSFTVKCELGKDVVSHTVEPTPCVVWPNLFCHTIEGLRSNRRYNVTVSARNTNLAEDGAEVTVTGITKESAPTVPEDLKVLNSSAASVGLQWRYPSLANGVMRSFVVSVEETEKFDPDSCCQIYPLVETPVQGELQTYEVEVSGLHPASTYYVSVSAKTVGLGPPQSVMVYTRPPHLPFTSLPSQDVQLELDWSLSTTIAWLPQENLPEVNNSDIYSPLVKAHLVLVMFNKTVQEPADSGIIDPQLESLLKNVLEKPFHFAVEYDQEGEVTGSVWGSGSSVEPDAEDYSFVAVQVTEYNGVYNIDLRYSTAE